MAELCTSQKGVPQEIRELIAASYLVGTKKLMGVPLSRAAQLRCKCCLRLSPVRPGGCSPCFWRDANQGSIARKAPAALLLTPVGTRVR